MKSLRLTGLLLVIILAITPIMALAQDDPEFEEYTTEDELLTLLVPEGWAVMDAGADEPLGVYIAESEETLEAVMSDDEAEPEEGQVGMIVILFPVEVLAFFGMDISEDVSQLEVAQVFSEMMLEGEEDGDTEVSEPEELEFDDEGEMVGAFIEITDEETDGALMVNSLSDEVIALVLVLTAPDELDDELFDIATTITGSLEYSGTTEEVMAAFFGAPEDDMDDDDMDDDDMDDDGDDDGDDMGADHDGAALVESRCTTCHTAERIENADKDEAAWTATVDRMIGYGADLDDAEREAVIEYLSSEME